MPNIPRNSEGNVDWPQLRSDAWDGTKRGAEWTRDTVIVPGAQKLDEFGRWTAEKAIVPVANWIVKNGARLVLAGADRVRGLVTDGRSGPLRDREFTRAVKAKYAELEAAAADMSPRAKANSLRAVYGLALLLSLYGGYKVTGFGEEQERLPAPVELVDGGSDPNEPVNLENMNPNDTLPEIENLAVMSVYEFSRDYNGETAESGRASYFETMHRYLKELTGPEASTTNIQSFKLYKTNSRGNLVEMPVRYSNGRVYVDGETSMRIPATGQRQSYARNSRSMGQRFSLAFLKQVAAYKVVEDGVTYMGVAPQQDQNDLHSYIQQLTDGEPDVAMMHTRGHTSYGVNLNIPDNVLNPAIVNLGGCRAGGYLESALRTHRGSALIAREVGTSWAENHQIAGDVMAVLKRYGVGGSNNVSNRVTWRQFSQDLRSESAFLASNAVLPGEMHYRTGNTY